MTDHPDLISPGVVLRFMTVVVAIGLVTAAVGWWVLS